MIIVTSRGVYLYANKVQECMARYFVAELLEGGQLEEEEEDSGHC